MTVEDIQKEIGEMTKDWEAFTKARGIIRARLIDIKDSNTLLTPLPNWSGTDAVLGSLDLAIHAMERTILELHDALSRSEPKKETTLRLITRTDE